MNPFRRRLLFVGATGAVVLTAARWWISADEGPAPPLSADGADVMHALVPAFLDGALPVNPSERRDAIESTIGAIASAIGGLPPAAREEIAALFAMLALAPVRIAFAGIGGAWRDASVDDANALLTRLRTSRWSVKRATYDALHQLTFAAWYANPRAWPAIGYPGPPALA